MDSDSSVLRDGIHDLELSTITRNVFSSSQALLNIQGYGSESENDSNDDFRVPASAPITVQSAPENFGLVEINSSEIQVEHVKTRKRKRNKKDWKSEVRKKRRQTGKDYIDRKGKAHETRGLKKACNCIKNCSILINEQRRQEIHAEFWTKNDATKQHFYNKHVSKEKVHRRCKIQLLKKQQKYTLHYHLTDSDNILQRVCQKMFLQTLNISKDRIYYFSKKTINHSTPDYLHGKNVSNSTGEYVKNLIRLHILSFPTVESHYCRMDSARKYLDPSLSISKMYRLFMAMGLKVPGIEEKNVKVSLTTYSKIFNEEFNLSFHRPKKDICEKCLIYLKLTAPTDIEKAAFELHQAKKVESRFEHTKDLNIDMKSTKTCVLSNDLQNTFSSPKGPADSWYYKRKFTSYHLTAKCANNGKTYSSFWDESQSGRNGNDLASATLSILNNAFDDDPSMEHIILWSDSCVPQNRNKMLSMAILMFLKDHPTVITFTQKFCEPGHSSIQEIDAVHSAIERYLRHKQHYSPISLTALLRTMNQPKVKLELSLLMPGKDYDFSTASCNYNFTVVPYTKVKALQYQANSMEIKFKTSFSETDWKSSSFIKTTRRGMGSSILPEIIALDQRKIKVPKEKVKDIISMMSLMPDADVQFYNNQSRIYQNNFGRKQT